MKRLFSIDRRDVTDRGEAAKARFEPFPWPLRCMSWVLVWSQLAYPYSQQVLAAVDTLAPLPEATIAAGPGSSTTPQGTINRTMPEVQPPASSPAFSDNPTEDEFFRARVFAEPLMPTGQTGAEENRGLAQALLTFVQRTESEDFSALTQFLAQYPQSAWRACLLLNLGSLYRQAGYFTRALATWEEVWAATKAAHEPKAKAIADAVLGELMELNYRLGGTERLERLFAEIQGRDIHGPATEKISAARATFSMMRRTPDNAYRCAPMALARLRALLNPLGLFDPPLIQPRLSTNGISLADACTLANRLNLHYQMARRQAGASVLVPSVVHWKAGHYSALVQEREGRYVVHDPSLGGYLHMSLAALESEASGYFLVPEGPLPTGWAPVSEAEGQGFYGKSSPLTSDPKQTLPYCTKVPGDPCSQGMAAHAFHAMLVSLNIVDTPIGYRPARGPAVEFTVTYNQRESGQPASAFNYSNLGWKWTFNWLAYITDDPQNTNAGVTHYYPGGGTEDYSGFDTNTCSFASHRVSGAKLVRTSPTSYERRLAHGSKELFTLADGNPFSGRKVFRTAILDAAGNTVSNVYDGNFRLVAIRDAVGQVTTISYGSTNATNELFYKISSVTDPFGRSATFDYTLTNNAWRLTKITDVIGVTSEFTYGTNDFITTLTTPYGKTTFTMGEIDTTRWIEATDPLGQKERVEFRNNAPGIASTEAVVPAGISPCNYALDVRNSFYWDKRAMALAPGDYTQAKLFHFLVEYPSASLISSTLESEKAPLESRIWYNYDGQPPIQFGASYQGTNDRPSKVGRVLDDGSSQLFQFEYNALRRVTKTVDPTNRTTLLVYETNLVDLVEARQQVGATNELLSKVSYNAQHLPLLAVDAAGQTNAFGYNAYGQLLALTNAKNEVIAMAYDTNGNLTNITGALAGATTGFTYDGTNRVRTITDSEGYTVTFDYDALDRPTQMTYPDGTFEQIVYKWLDPVLRKDRRGHWTATYYDALRRVTDIQDALNRVTHFEWCDCGSLESITDPLGRTTTWLRDLRGRPTTKLYPDNTQITYAYETNSSRLKSVTDAKNQTTWYAYYVDDNLKQVSYSNAVVATPSVTFSYDTNYNRVLTMVDGIGTNTYAYYAVSNGLLGAGRLQSVDGPLTNDAVTYTYDELGRVRSRAIDGVAEEMTYDALGRVTTVTNALGAFTNTYVNATFRLSTNFYPNGQNTVFTYYGATNDFRLQQIQHSTINTQLSAFSYTYDADGQIQTWTQQADTGTPQVWALEYDPVDQLLSATVHSNAVAGAILKRRIYSYDKAGNRLSEQIDTGVIRANHNNLNQLNSTEGGGPVRFAGRLSEAGTVQIASTPAAMGLQNTSFMAQAEAALGTNVLSIKATDYSNNSRTNQYQVVVTNSGVTKTLTYDLNGNLTNVVTASSTNSYEWDAANRMVKITQRSAGNPELTSEFTFDGLGRRVRIVEKTNGVLQSDKRFLWVGTELAQERGSTGANLSKRFFRLGEQISGTNYFFTRDHLWSIRDFTDQAATVRARYDYDPYGHRTRLQGAADADPGFTGHYYHTATGLHFTLYRAYDVNSARWMSRDPVAEVGAANAYAYVRNDPINGIDPNGLAKLTLNGTDYPVNSKVDFILALQSATSDGALISTFTFEGHGEPSTGALQVASDKDWDHAYIWPYQLDIYLNKFAPQFAPNAKIELKACGSANPNAHNAALAFKKALPEAHVYGYSGLYLDIPYIYSGGIVNTKLTTQTIIGMALNPGKGGLKGVPLHSEYIEVNPH